MHGVLVGGLGLEQADQQSSELDSYPDNSRFARIEGIGQGSMCSVFKSRDLRFGDVVALKTLRQPDANSLYRLKQEFRALSTIDHPNLVSFYELVGSKDGWFVTMELVEGQDFQQWCRRTDTGALHRFDELKLRSALRQIAEGVATLHESGHIHRDLKAENVLVTAAGRVVILDFGLVLEYDTEFTEGTLHQNLAGSAAYMSPEQSLGEVVGPASDWYSVGVMLYEALTGRWPFEGNIYEILMAKHEGEPPPPSSFVPEVPADLNWLCMALLRRRPSERIGVGQILAQLSSRRPMLDMGAAHDYNTRLNLFAELKRCFDRSQRGGPVVCRVTGEAGVGKSGIIREFIRRLRREGGPHALKGCCYEWERVPHKALDGVLDNLSRVFRREASLDTSEISDEDLACLGEVFPVIRRVDSLDREFPDTCTSWSRAERRAATLRGFCGLLRAASKTAPLLVFLDDVQWGDVQSAAFLSEAVAALKDVPLLVLICDDSVDTGGFLQTCVRTLEREDIPITRVEVRPLPLDEAAAVAGSLLRMPSHRDVVQHIAREAAGAPARIVELSRLHLVRSAGKSARGDVAAFDSVGSATIANLPASALRLLRLTAVAGGSILTDVVIGAAALGEDSFDALSTLRAHQLVDVTAWISEDRVEIASSEIRDYLVARLQAKELEQLYYDLAIALELSDAEDPRSLVRYYLGAGRYSRASLVAMRAASGAAAREEYSEVAWLLDRALDLGTWSPVEQRALYVRLGEARARVGVGAQVARVFEAAMEPKDPTPFQLAAMEQWLAAGEVARGDMHLRSLLSDHGYPRLGGALWQRLTTYFWDQDYPWPEMGDTSDSQEDFICDVVAKAALTLSWTDRNLGYRVLMAARRKLSSRVGKEQRARLYANQAFYQIQRGGDPSDYLARCEQIASERGSHDLLAYTRLLEGQIALIQGQWIDALLAAGAAEQIFEDHCNEQLWQHRLAKYIVLKSQLHRGDWSSVSEHLRALRAGLEHEENALWATLVTAGLGAWLRMAEDEAELGAREVVEILRLWPTTEFWLPHAYAITALGNLYLYMNEPDEAWALLQSSWRLMRAKHSQLDATTRAQLYVLRAKVALTLAKRESSRVRWLAVAQESLHLISEEGLDWCSGVLLVLEAFIDRLTGQGDGLQRLRDAYGRFEECDMRIHAAILAIVLQGQLEDAVAARNWLSEQGVRDLRRFASVIVPTYDL
jgi:eukaryotic-like serine/threonine-protein kinase